MKRKILYILGGIFVIFVIITATSPSPEKTVIKGNEQNKSILADTKVDSAFQVLSPTKTTPPITSSNYTYYPISKVVDGDTVKVNIDGKEETFRLIGMDTPETVDPRKPVQCFGKEASNKAKELLSGKKIRIETDPSQGTYDKYNRLLGYIYLEDGLFYNKYMIEQGYAHEYTYQGNSYKYQNEFKKAQKEAESSKSGLWSPDTCNGDTTSSNPITSTLNTNQS